MRASKVVPTDDEVRAGMKASNAAPKAISEAIATRQAQTDENQRAYDRATSPFVSGLQRQNQE